MKIKLLTAMSGPAGSFAVGETVDRDPAEARRLVDAGFAEAAEAWPKSAPRPEPQAETAAEESADKAEPAEQPAVEESKPKKGKGK